MEEKICEILNEENELPDMIRERIDWTLATLPEKSKRKPAKMYFPKVAAAMIALCLFTSTAVFAGTFWDVDFLNYMGIGEEKASKPEMLVNVAVSDSSKEGIQLNIRNVASDGYHLFILLDAEGLSENEKGYHFEEICFNGDIHGQEYGITSEYIGRKDDKERFIVRVQDFGEGLDGKTCRLELKGLADYSRFNKAEEIVSDHTWKLEWALAIQKTAKTKTVNQTYQPADGSGTAKIEKVILTGFEVEIVVSDLEGQCDTHSESVIVKRKNGTSIVNYVTGMEMFLDKNVEQFDVGRIVYDEETDTYRWIFTFAEYEDLNDIESIEFAGVRIY